MSSPKTLLLGVTGSIAAFKAVELASAMTKRRWRVLTMLTRAAEGFVQPLSFAAVTRRPVLAYRDPPDTSTPLDHVTAAAEGDVLVVAPASANTIGKMAHGIADNFLLLTALAFTGPVLVAPAMNTHMYKNVMVQDNIKRLQEKGFSFVGPGEGRLACGDTGPGRLAPIDEIIEAIEALAGRPEES